MNSLSTLAGIAGIHLLAIASPGPTLAAVLSQALRGDRRSGLLLACGVVLATLVWAGAAAAGLNRLLASLPTVYLALQLLGAAYLGYLGLRLLADVLRRGAPAPRPEARAVSGWRAVRTGFVTNLGNPKVIAYYASLFGVIIPADAPEWLFFASVATVALVSALWWSAATLLLTRAPIRQLYAGARPACDALMGVALVGFAVRLVTTA